MPMQIKSIRLANFQCYFGENNQFEFGPGLNLVLGDNGAGKSKLYDAFYWILQDEVFDSRERAFKKTGLVKGNLVSDKAKNECEAGNSVKTEVELVVIHPAKAEEFTLTRSYSIQKNADSQTWQKPLESTLTIVVRDAYKNARLLSSPAEREQVLREILPSDVKSYMWFQGEQVDSLIDFKEKETLTKAINVLSDIREFDFLVDVSQKAKTTADDELRKMRSRFASDKKKNEDLETRREEILKKLGRLEIEQKEAAENLTQARERKKELIGKFDDAGKIKALNHQKESIERQLQETVLELKEKETRLQKGLFSRAWLVKGTDFLVEAFSRKFGEYEKKRARKEQERELKKQVREELAREYLLPAGVPEPVYIQGMLDDEHCKVCDREAKKGSLAYEKILELLHRASAKQEKSTDEPLTVHDFSADFRRLYQNGQTQKAHAHRADEDIKTALDDQQKLDNRRKKLTAELETSRRDLDILLDKTRIGSVESSESVLKDFQNYDKSESRFQSELIGKQNESLRERERLRETEEDLRQLSKDKMPANLTERVTVLSDFAAVAESTRARVFNRLIEQLEAEANRHFWAMTEKNAAVRGQIKLEKQPNGNYMPRNLDRDGNELTSINDSNIILIKLAVIMAIISARQGGNETAIYPLITDAATSKFSENYAIGFSRTASEVYGQSICMSKDFLSPSLRERLFQEIPADRLGSVYLIEPSVAGGDRADRRELETRITKLQ